MTSQSAAERFATTQRRRRIATVFFVGGVVAGCVYLFPRWPPESLATISAVGLYVLFFVAFDTASRHPTALAAWFVVCYSGLTVAAAWKLQAMGPIVVALILGVGVGLGLFGGNKARRAATQKIRRAVRRKVPPKSGLVP